MSSWCGYEGVQELLKSQDLASSRNIKTRPDLPEALTNSMAIINLRKKQLSLGF